MMNLNRMMKKNDAHTSTPCPNSSVDVLLMTSQSIADDVTIKLPDPTILTQHEKWSVIYITSILFMEVLLYRNIPQDLAIYK